MSTQNRPRGRAVALMAGDVHLVRRTRTVVLVVLVLACVLGLQRPEEALGGWPLAEEASVILGFGVAYSAGEGESSQHRGVDLEAASGTSVVAPLAGCVTFAGKVPGVGGGRVFAVTIETARGKITLLPLDGACVSRGAQVGEGDRIGELAESGDGSSSGPHLHVGAREGDLYVDPLGLIALPPPTPVDAPGSSSEVGVGSAAEVGVGAGSPTAEGLPAGTVAGAAAGAELSAGVSLAPRAGEAPARSGAKVAGAGEIAPGVSIARHSAAPSGVEAPTRNVALAGTAASGGSASVRAQQATVLTPDGIVVAASAASSPARGAWDQWLAGTATRVRALAARSLRVASFVLLGVMAALGALWPLWRRSGRKGSGKVLVSAVGEDVAAAPSR